jgi:phospholipid/cholesterol/gamma-HCH transport system substrate-binding protein
MLRRRRTAGIGMIAIAAAALALAVIKPDPFTDRYTVWAQFDNVNGLGSIDRDIRVAGVNSGEIGEVKRVGDDALVQLEVDDDVVVHSDAQVALRPHTLFEGSAFVDLHPGSPSASPLTSGATLPRRQTRVYVTFDEALRVFDAPTREHLRAFLLALPEATGGKAPQALQRTLRAAPRLGRELGPTALALQGSGGDELAGAISATATTIDELARRESSLASIAERSDRTLAALNIDGAGPLDRALAELPGPLETLRDRGAAISGLIDRSSELAVALRPALAEFAPALRELRPLLVAVTPPTRLAVPLVEGLATVLRRATSASPALRKLLEILRPATVAFERRVLPAMHAESRLGLPTYEQLLAGFAGGGAALRPYQTAAQGTLGVGHLIRLGAYFDPAASSNLAGTLPCDELLALNPEVGALLEDGGFCK